ncbi:MAG: hypothetical protein FWE80_03515 [Oscillospiraceae bacterium]|nr:hypothetical protein [Oscillospiraceae bacterium]
MPALMVHLAAARLLMPRADTLFYIGNIAPDAVTGHYEKDHTHLRDLPLARREAELRRMASTAGPLDIYAQGVIFHLYLDMCWDRTHLLQYIEDRADWFVPYRAEISLVSALLFRRLPWADPLWRRMDDYDCSALPVLAGADGGAVAGLIDRNGRWHREQPGDRPSAAFPPELVERFMAETAEAYKTFWRDAAGMDVGFWE